MSRNLVVAMVLLIACAGCGNREAPSDPARDIQCKPSPGCAVELAKAYARADAKEQGDPTYYSFHLSSLAWEMLERHDTTLAASTVEEYAIAVHASNPPPDQELTTLALLQAALGRRAEAFTTLAQTRDPAEKKQGIVALARLAFRDSRFDDAVAAIDLLPAADRHATGIGLARDEFNNGEFAVARSITNKLELDLAREPLLALGLQLREDSANRYESVANALARYPPAEALQLARLLLQTDDFDVTAEALPLLRIHRDLYGKGGKTFASEYDCRFLAESFARAGSVAEADALVGKCSLDDRESKDDFLGSVVEEHAFAGNFDAAEALASKIMDTYERKNAMATIAQARVLVAHEAPEVAFEAIRDRWLRVEHFDAVANSYREQKRLEDARGVLHLALRSARSLSRDEESAGSIASIGSDLAEMGFPADAVTLLPNVTDAESRIFLLCAIGVAEAKAGVREPAAKRFAEAHQLARAEAMNAEQVQIIIEWQAEAGLTHEALAAARAMPEPSDDRDISRDMAFEAAILAMARNGEHAEAFAVTRSLPRFRALIFDRIYRALMETPITAATGK